MLHVATTSTATTAVDRAAVDGSAAERMVGDRVVGDAVRTEAALLALARGLALFPLPAGGRLPRPGWHQQTSTDPDTVRSMIAAGNVGVGCRACDVVGIDLDRRAGVDGVARFAAAAAAAHAGWPDTLTVRTPGGGLHLYFRARGRPISSTSGRSRLGAGVDTRGPGRRFGGYLIAPGSVVSAGAYVITRNAPIQDLPEWLVEALTPP